MQIIDSNQTEAMRVGIPKRNDFISVAINKPQLRPVRVDNENKRALKIFKVATARTGGIVSELMVVCKRKGVTTIIEKVIWRNSKACIVKSDDFGHIINFE